MYSVLYQVKSCLFGNVSHNDCYIRRIFKFFKSFFISTCDNKVKFSFVEKKFGNFLSKATRCSSDNNNFFHMMIILQHESFLYFKKSITKAGTYTIAKRVLSSTAMATFSG